MKLSEAIRKGCEISKPMKRGFSNKNPKDLCACALGAAILAVTKEKSEDFDNEVENMMFMHRIESYFPDAYSANNITNPITGIKNCYLDDIIYDLNDYEDWTREQIADWVESVGY